MNKINIEEYLTLLFGLLYIYTRYTSSYIHEAISNRTVYKRQPDESSVFNSEPRFDLCSGDLLFFKPSQKPKQMLHKENGGTTSADQVITPENIVSFITEANTPIQHRVNLSAMMIEWLRHDFNVSDGRKREIYNTYYALSEALRMIEKGGQQ